MSQKKSDSQKKYDSENKYDPMKDPLALLSIERVSQITGRSKKSLARDRRLRIGMPFVALNHNAVRYRLKDVNNFIDSHVVAVTS